MFVNSVKIDGDGEASDFEKDEVENDFDFICQFVQKQLRAFGI